VLATDTQKNTVYAMAKKLGGIEPEAFALELARTTPERRGHLAGAHRDP